MQIQTVGFVSHLWKKAIQGPFIVIAPLSTLTNWESEFKKWAPSVPVLLYHGSKPERQKMRTANMSRSEPTSPGPQKQVCSEQRNTIRQVLAFKDINVELHQLLWVPSFGFKDFSQAG